MSPKLASCLAKVSSPASSAAWNLKFSKSKTPPGAKASTAAWAFSPTQSSLKATGTPNTLDTASTIKERDMLGVTCPFGRPKWLINTAFPPCANTASMVDFAAEILLVSVTCCASFIGTLKSTRIRATWSLKLKSESVFMGFFKNCTKTNIPKISPSNRAKR